MVSSLRRLRAEERHRGALTDHHALHLAGLDHLQRYPAAAAGRVPLHGPRGAAQLALLDLLSGLQRLRLPRHPPPLECIPCRGGRQQQPLLSISISVTFLLYGQLRALELHSRQLQCPRLPKDRP